MLRAHYRTVPCVVSIRSVQNTSLLSFDSSREIPFFEPFEHARKRFFGPRQATARFFFGRFGAVFTRTVVLCSAHQECGATACFPRVGSGYRPRFPVDADDGGHFATLAFGKARSVAGCADRADGTAIALPGTPRRANIARTFLAFVSAASNDSQSMREIGSSSSNTTTVQVGRIMGAPKLLGSIRRLRVA